MLKNYGRVTKEMDENKESFLWNDAMALAIHKELKKLKALVKRVDTLYKKTAKQKKKEQNDLRDTTMSDSQRELF
jgi:quinol monooxygenase YgiN